MKIRKVIAAADGWVHSIIEQDWPDGRPLPDRPTVYYPEPGASLPAEPPLLFLTPGKVLTTPHSDEVAWLRLRTLMSGAEAADRVMARDAVEMEDLIDIPAAVTDALTVVARNAMAAANVPQATRTRLQSRYRGPDRPVRP